MKMPDIHQGDLVAKPGTVYQFEQITGSLYASGADTKTAFPKLTTVGGSLDASGADTKTAFPKLTTVGGSLDARGADTKTAFPKLTTVGGYLDARGADTKTAFPKLTTVGSYLYASFGAAQVHEDDAARALRAALAFKDAVAGTPCRVQMGLSSGTLRVGGYGGRTRRSFGAMGDDVNTAARLWNGGRLPSRRS